MNELALQIREEINRNGPISFARFMELALNAPGLGYYERQRDIGRRGDFFTSVSVGPLLGEMLAFQFARWLCQEHSRERVQIVEAGAHDGRLAADILGWLRHSQPEWLTRLEYFLIEPSPTRRAWQKETLREFQSTIKWFADIAELNASAAGRIIFCNELLDAMLVHRLTWDAEKKKWNESRVTWDGGAFAWQTSAPPAELTKELPAVDAELAAVLPHGFSIEHSPAAIAWWQKAAAALNRGKLLTIDYGLIGLERFRPERGGGTLRGYSRHHPAVSLFDNPGENDLTAHVDFSALEAAGRATGLATDALIEQGQFLTGILAQINAEPGSFGDWSPARAKQFQTLTHPDHLGRSFRVLIQSR